MEAEVAERVYAMDVREGEMMVGLADRSMLRWDVRKIPPVYKEVSKQALS
jgi:hypothetical protein